MWHYFEAKRNKTMKIFEKLEILNLLFELRTSKKFSNSKQSFSYCLTTGSYLIIGEKDFFETKSMPLFYKELKVFERKTGFLLQLEKTEQIEKKKRRGEKIN